MTKLKAAHPEKQAEYNASLLTLHEAIEKEVGKLAPVELEIVNQAIEAGARVLVAVCVERIEKLRALAGKEAVKQ